MYLSYAEYQAMGGTLDEATFTGCELEAEMIINWYTFNRLKNDDSYPNEVKQCVYLLIKYIDLQSQLAGVDSSNSGDTIMSGASIASQSNDGVSVSYNILSAQDLMANAQDKLKTTVEYTLQGVTNSLGRKLLYRGLYPGE